MTYYNFKSQYSSDHGRMTKSLIFINVGVYFLINIFFGVRLFYLFGMVPQLIISKFMVWQLFTYMFLHAGLWHLAINMLMLWFFGPTLESIWGRQRFLRYYFFTGIGAGLCSFVFSLNSYTPVIGASGAIFGILVAYAVMFPDNMVLMFFILPMKMKHAIFFLAGINLFGAMSGSGSEIAYFAHLGGGLFGYWYLKSRPLKDLLDNLSLDKLKTWLSQKSEDQRRYQEQDLNRKVDEILDKISKSGMDSLTDAEKDVLKKKGKLNCK